MTTSGEKIGHGVASRMKAITAPRYGPPEVLELQEVPTPVPGPDEILIEVHAAALNPADCHVMRGSPFLVRLDNGLRKPKHGILGADVAGRIEAVGSDVTALQPGDEVFGDLSGIGFGAFAEYVCVPQTAVTSKPAKLTFEQAAAVPLAGSTALQALRDSGGVQAGQSVLINGASGGVGTFAVQIAKAFGAEVTGVCSTQNLELVESLGADHVIDYTQEDVTRTGRTYDLVLDAVGNLSVGQWKRLLTVDGVCVVVGFTTIRRLVTSIVGGTVMSATGRRQITVFMAKTGQAELNTLRELIEAGDVEPVIDRRYPLADVPSAIAYLETGHARGKVVVTVA